MGGSIGGSESLVEGSLGVGGEVFAGAFGDWRASKRRGFLGVWEWKKVSRLRFFDMLQNEATCFGNWKSIEKKFEQYLEYTKLQAKDLELRHS